LMKDLDLTDFISENYPTEGWTPIGVETTPFKGVFDGNSHKISGVWIKKSTINYVGFFGYVSGATIKNLSLEISVNGVNYVGALAGYALSSTFINNTCEANIKGTYYIGGLVGHINSCNISSSVVNGSILGSNSIGGIVGQASGTQTFANDIFKGDVSGYTNVGGIVGELVSSSSNTFTSCFSKCTIINTGDYTGGIVGKSNGACIAAMTDCSHFGDISGKQYIGGLIGASLNELAVSDQNVYISTEYSSNTKSASKPINNFIPASTTEKLVNNCTAIGNITGTSYVGGLIGWDEKALSCSDWVSGGKTTISCSTTYITSSYSTSLTFYIWYNGRFVTSKSFSSSSGTYISSSGTYSHRITGSFSPNISTTATAFTNSYYSGVINGTDNVGGIAGNKMGGRIQNCYTSASIYGNNNIGGIIGSVEGHNSGAYLTLKSNVAINTTISATVAGLGRIYGKLGNYVTIGELASAEGNRALTTTKVILKGVVQEITDDKQNGNVMGPSLLKLKANYVALGWDFDNNWAILETECFPYKKYQAAPPVIESELVSQDTEISGSSTDGGQVYLYYKNREAVSTTCTGNAWSFTTEPLQSGASVQLYVDAGDKTPSYLTSTVVGYPGKGTEADPYRIYTAEDLQGASNKGYYKVMNDIDLTTWINENNSKEGWVAIGRNSGEATYINGDGHKITGLWINTTADYTGLFSNFSAGIIKNLTVEVAKGKKVKGGNYTGILIGRNANGQLLNCVVNGDVEGTTYVGGAVGYSESNTVNNVSYTGTVTSATANANVGGFAGYTKEDDITSVRSTATINTTNSGVRVGGVSGMAESSTITKSQSQATITASGTGNYVGGLVGYSQSAISQCFTTGTVKGTGDDSYTGGLVGYTKSSITDCYSTADVTGTQHTAGLCAYSFSSIEKCYAKGDVNGVNYGAGVVSNVDGASAKITKCVALNNILSLSAQSSWGSRVLGGFRNGALEPGNDNYALSTMQVSLNGVAQKKTDDPVEGIAKTSAELMNHSFYMDLGWDMTTTWAIENGEAYPYLLWEVDVNPVTELTLDKDVLLIAQDKTAALSATVMPLSATNKNLVWSSSNEAVATVDATGVVTGMGVGNATITVKTADGSNLSATCAVTVVANKDAAIEELEALIDKAMDLYTNSTEGENIGQYAMGARAELYSVITFVKAQVSSTMTDEAITACTNQINNAIATFNSKKVTGGADTDTMQYSNIVYFANVEGRANTQVTLSLQMKNADPVIGFNFKLYLPEGMTVASAEDEWGDVTIDAALSGNRTSASRHSFETALNKEGVLNVLCYSVKNYTFKGNTGEVAQIKINIGDSVAVGDYPIIIKEEAISLSGSTPQINYVKSTITISDYKLGDANGDTFINVGDITAVAAYILENTPAIFIEKAADANEDNAINVGDITTIANIILHDGETAPARRASGINDPIVAQFALVPTQQTENSLALAVMAENNENAVSAFQFDLRLPENVSINDVRFHQERLGYITYDMTMLENNTLRVLAYSTTDTRIMGTDGALVTVEIVNYSNGEISLVNGVFANGNNTLYANDVVLYRKMPTNLDVISESTNKDAFDILGRKLNETGKGIRIVGNKVVFIK